MTRARGTPARAGKGPGGSRSPRAARAARATSLDMGLAGRGTESLTARIELHFLEACRRAGRAISIDEAWTTWDASRPPHTRKHFGTTVATLAQRHILVWTEGSYGYSRFAHALEPYPPANDNSDDLLPVVYGALCQVHTDAVATRGGPTNVLTSEVRTALSAAGVSVTAARLGAMLRRLASAAKKGAPEFRIPRLTHIQEHSAGGQLTHWWRPLGNAAPPDLTVRARSQRDAIFFAVEATTRALGRPPTRFEIALRVAACRDEEPALSDLDSSSLGRVLTFAQASEAVHSPGRRVHRLEGPLACHGGTRTYFFVGDGENAPIPGGDRALWSCRVLDAVRAYAPAEEVASIVALEMEAHALDLPVLAELASIRRQLLRTLMLDLVAPPIGTTGRGREDGDDHHRNPPDCAGDRAGDRVRRDDHDQHTAALMAVDLAEQSLSVVRVWIDAERGDAQPSGTRGYRLKVNRDQLRGCAAARMIIEDRAAYVTPSGVLPHSDIARAVCGHAALLDHPAVAEIAIRVGYLPAGSTGTAALPDLFTAARRFPGPVTRRPRTGNRFIAPEPLSRIDRVDVLRCVITASGLPNALALLGSAMTMMGYVLRDAVVLRSALDAIPVSEGWARRALVVALGLLGEPLPLEVALADPNEPLDVEACIFAATLLSPEAGVEVATAIYAASADLGVAAVADEALARLEAGDYLGVVG